MDSFRNGFSKPSVIGFFTWVFVSLLSPTLLRAQAEPIPEQAETTRGLALGLGLRATAASTSGIVYNPAGMTLGKLYHIEGSSLYEPNSGRLSVMAAIIDSVTAAVAAGLYVRGIFATKDVGHSGFDAKLALALPLSEAFSIGIAGRYLTLSREGPAPANAMNMSSRLARGFTMDGAFRFSPIPMLHFAALANNFIKMDSPYAPITVGGSTALQLLNGSLSFGGDLLFDLTTFDKSKPLVGGGAEYLAIGRIPIRAGYVFDGGRKTHAITGGVGYVDDKMGVDMAIRQRVAGGKETTLMLAFRFFVQ